MFQYKSICSAGPLRRVLSQAGGGAQLDSEGVSPATGPSIALVWAASSLGPQEHFLGMLGRLKIKPPLSLTIT